jgi:hypothetical protein
VSWTEGKSGSIKDAIEITNVLSVDNNQLYLQNENQQVRSKIIAK